MSRERHAAACTRFRRPRDWGTPFQGEDPDRTDRVLFGGNLAPGSDIRTRMTASGSNEEDTPNQPIATTTSVRWLGRKGVRCRRAWKGGFASGWNVYRLRGKFYAGPHCRTARAFRHSFITKFASRAKPPWALPFANDVAGTIRFNSDTLLTWDLK